MITAKEAREATPTKTAELLKPHLETIENYIKNAMSKGYYAVKYPVEKLEYHLIVELRRILSEEPLCYGVEISSGDQREPEANSLLISWK